MRSSPLLPRIFAAFTLLLAGASPAFAQGNKPPAQPPASGASAEDAEAVVEPAALEIMKAAWDWLGAQESYALHADVEYDEIYGDDTHVRVAGGVDLLVRRPDRFKIFFDGDRGKKTYIYDGASFSLNDLESRTWASAPVTGPNDKAVDQIVEKLGVPLPLSDFLGTGAAYSAGELRAAYIVGQSSVLGRRCHQILVMLDDLDFQLWVEADGNPVIRKLVLTYRTAGYPQYEATFTEWYPMTKLSDYVFSFVPDDSFRKVRFAEPVAPMGKE